MPPRKRTPERGPSARNTRPGQRGGATRVPSSTGAAPRARFTNRAAVLVVVFAILVIAYASSMRAYLHQRALINNLNAQIAQAETNINALQLEKNRWRDPAYVEQQARLRFGWVLPGQTAYQVLDQNGNPLTGGNELTDPTTIDPNKPEAWWSKVQQSLDAADHPEKLVKPTPVTTIAPPTPKNH